MKNGDDTPSEPPVEVEDDDEASLLDQSPMEKIIRMTEENMLSGWSQLRCYQFCIQFGLDRTTFDRIWDNIKTAWKMPTMTFATFCDQRDLARARLNKIYNKSMKRNQPGNALAAVNAIIKLDGLDQPAQLQITLNQNATPGQITNSARDNVSQLIDKMKQLAAPIDDGFDEIVETPSTEPQIVRKTALTGYVQKPDKNGVIEIEGRYPVGHPDRDKS